MLRYLEACKEGNANTHRPTHVLVHVYIVHEGESLLYES